MQQIGTTWRFMGSSKWDYNSNDSKWIKRVIISCMSLNMLIPIVTLVIVATRLITTHEPPSARGMLLLSIQASRSERPEDCTIGLGFRV